MAEWVKYAVKGFLEELGINSLKEIANASSEVIIQIHANTHIWMEIDLQLEEAGLPLLRELSESERMEVRRRFIEKKQTVREERSARRQKRRENLLQDVKELIAEDEPIPCLEELAAEYHLTKYEALDVLKPAGPIPGWRFEVKLVFREFWLDVEAATVTWHIYQEVAGYLARGVHVPSRQDLAMKYGVHPESVSAAVDSLGKIPGWKYKEGKSKAERIREAIQLCLDNKIQVPSAEELAERFETTTKVVRAAAEKICQFRGWPRKKRA